MANGFIWPYVVIWASSQAKQESLWFLRTIRDLVSTGNFVSFKTKKKNEILNFQNSVVEWKKSERKGKYGKSIQQPARKLNDDCNSISTIKVTEFQQEPKHVPNMMSENELENLSIIINPNNTISPKNLEIIPQTKSFLAPKVEPIKDIISADQDQSQLMTLSSLINGHEEVSKRHRCYSRQKIDSLNIYFDKAKYQGIDCKNGKERENQSIRTINTWTENDMVNPQRKSNHSNSTKFSTTASLDRVNKSNLFQKSTIEKKTDVPNKNQSLPKNKNHMKNNVFCNLNVPASEDIDSENNAYLQTSTSTKSFRNIKTISKRKSTRKDKTLLDLKSIMKDCDNPIKNNVNAIMDPIRRCNNIASIHLGDLSGNQKN